MIKNPPSYTSDILNAKEIPSSIKLVQDLTGTLLNKSLFSSKSKSKELINLIFFSRQV